MIKNLIETVKRGDLEKVLQEKDKLNLDLALIVDEGSFKQNLIFPAA